MRERRYLLNIEQMLEGSGRDALFREAFERIDGTRRQKVLSVKNARSQAAGIGAGLLIRKALADHMTECRVEPGVECVSECRVEPGAECVSECRVEPGAECVSECRAEPGAECAAERPVLECFAVEELLSMLERRNAEPCYRYGKNGKPYLKDHPFQFNLSHSGDYVFCGVSNREIGVDIQKIQGDNMLRLAKRFFAAPERRALDACGDEELRRRMFFRMWVRKEAYGKLTGEGIPGAVGKCLWREDPVGEETSDRDMEKELWWENDLVWEEYDVPYGYRMAVCRFRWETASG